MFDIASFVNLVLPFGSILSYTYWRVFYFSLRCYSCPHQMCHRDRKWASQQVQQELRSVKFDIEAISVPKQQICVEFSQGTCIYSTVFTELRGKLYLYEEGHMCFSIISMCAHQTHRTVFTACAQLIVEKCPAVVCSGARISKGP